MPDDIDLESWVSDQLTGHQPQGSFTYTSDKIYISDSTTEYPPPRREERPYESTDKVWISIDTTDAADPRIEHPPEPRDRPIFHISQDRASPWTISEVPVQHVGDLRFDPNRQVLMCWNGNMWIDLYTEDELCARKEEKTSREEIKEEISDRFQRIMEEVSDG